MFKSKADTILSLEDKLKFSVIPKTYVFTIGEWKKNSDLIYQNIKKYFKTKNIAIRSSSREEDTFKSSAAGKFLSFLNIKTNQKKNFYETIRKVIQSYTKGTTSLKDQVLIQEMITNIKMSGVIFSHNISDKSPYYVINYDDISGLTDTVTSGYGNSSNKSLSILRNKTNYLRSKRFIKIIKSN